MSSNVEQRREPKWTLQSMDIHSAWTRQFRTAENDAFYNLAFDYIAQVYGPPDDQPVVDAGCGSAIKSLHLARRGYRVKGLDFSTAVLAEARQAAQDAGLAHRIEFEQGDLTALKLETGSVHRAVCWGVLMHVPDVERAVAELARIMAPSGKLVISEGNFRSVQARTLRALKRILRRERGEFIYAPAGIEHWEETSSGKLMTRQADIPWLVAEFEKHGLKLVQRRAGQFTEIYMIVPWKPVRLLIHVFNNLWFRLVRSAGVSYGNILVFERRSPHVVS